jgi:predicted amidohydrolase
LNDKPKAAVIQMDSVTGDLAGNLYRAEVLIQEACRQGASLVVLPELFAFGYNPELAGRVPSGQNETLDFINDMAGSGGICLAGGFLEEVNGLFYNSLAVSCRGEQAVYRKMHLFPPAGEEAVFRAGDKPVTVEWEGLKIGLSICFDLRFPALYRYYRDAGCQAVIVSAAFPFPRQEHWRILLRSRAIENQLYVAAANRCGQTGSLVFCGGSALIDPWGVDMDLCDDSSTSIAVGVLSRAVVDEVRSKIPCRF